MSTTDLFVELIIIGIGTAIWLFLLLLSVFGYDWIPLEEASSLAALIPALSVVYVLGIVIDRVADTVFDKLWNPSHLRKVYDKQEEYFDDKQLIYIHPGRLGNLMEYGRSRLRICRGWALNGALILVSLNIFIWTRIHDYYLRPKLSVFCSLIIGLFTYGNWFSWRQLNLTNYRKVQKQSAFLRAIKSTDGAESRIANSGQSQSH
jgi:hypothetical protein